ncbi:hypothetical protein EVAR_32973_1 [Eumeta japonica]|uniref:Uncharacterized protein n=1 Tax=Eumeta variegata TaxID=151549 RepID=A0A4C1WWJ9_EUMVA|nr:hypothetical protein EVAR_32973_1 [Eumeta japonica]
MVIFLKQHSTIHLRTLRPRSPLPAAPAHARYGMAAVDVLIDGTIKLNITLEMEYLLANFGCWYFQDTCNFNVTVMRLVSNDTTQKSFCVEC